MVSPRRLALVALLALVACRRTRTPPQAPFSVVEHLRAHRTAPHADAVAGDLVVRQHRGPALLIANHDTPPGVRPMRGAVLDAVTHNHDASDPLLWWRPGVAHAPNTFVTAPATTVERFACDRITQGVRTIATVEGATLTTTYCPLPDGDFEVETRAANLRPGFTLGDEIHPGSAGVLVQDQGHEWEGQGTSRFVALAENDTALTFTTADAATAAQRTRVHIARETFPAAVRWIAPAGDRFVRRVHIQHGDLLDALAYTVAPSAARVIDLVAPPSLPATIELLDAQNNVLAHGTIATARRRLVLPVGYGTSLRIRDARGLRTEALPLPTSTTAAYTLRTPTLQGGRIRFNVTDPEGVGLPVHVLFRARNGADPAPRVVAPDHGFAAERSVYLLDGKAAVHLAPGAYSITISHGTAWTIDHRDVTVVAGEDATVTTTLRDVLPIGPRLAADLHLHAAPSPDSSVSLDDRVASLACNGVEFAIATDHNRITDYQPAVAHTGLGRWITTMIGDEITSVGAPLWGHFNAFPLPPPGREFPNGHRVPVYFEVGPREIFASARAAGAGFLQVNHPRMQPNIGYFDLARFNAATGEAGPNFVDTFDAVEVHNGVWIEQPAEVRRALQDVIGLARRGRRVTVTGNSDSHKLLFNEAGYPRTYVLVEREPTATLPSRFIEALRQGRTTVSSGPFVEMTVNGSPVGSTVALPTVVGGLPGVRVHVRVSAPAWVPVDRVEVWRDDVVVERIAVTSGRIDGVRWEGDVLVPVAADAAITAWVESDTPLPDVMPYRDARAIGFTNPVWVDANADGEVRLPAAGR